MVCHLGAGICIATDSADIVQGTANTLTRSEVRGGGKKPYAQKGTGNARIGSRRTPLRPGGGISFGPKVCHVFIPCLNAVSLTELLHSYTLAISMFVPSVQTTDWSIKINKKERRLAVATALQNAATDIMVTESLKVSPSSPGCSLSWQG